MMPVVSLEDTYGAALIGLIASAVLYGITLLQTYQYWRKYPDDGRLIKFLVVFLWFLDTLHLLLCTTSIHTYLIANYMNPAALGQSNWAMNLQTDCNGLIGLIVECFFARRLWMLSRNPFLVGVIVVLAFVHFGLGVYFTVQGFILVDLAKFSELIWVTSAGLGSAAAADLIIAISLCYYLMKNRTGITRTDSIITTLIGYSITAGILTGIIAFLCVVLFAVMPTNYIWLAFFWSIGKLYVNSFLASLNSRKGLRECLFGNFEEVTYPPQQSSSATPSTIEKGLQGGQEKLALAVDVYTRTVTTKTVEEYPVRF